MNISTSHVIHIYATATVLRNNSTCDAQFGITDSNGGTPTNPGRSSPAYIQAVNSYGQLAHSWVGSKSSTTTFYVRARRVDAGAGTCQTQNAMVTWTAVPTSLNLTP